MIKKFNKAKGFTLVEVLLVIVIIAALSAIVIIAINPGKQIEDALNMQRKADLNALESAVNQYMIENRGQTPPGVDENLRMLGTGVGDCNFDCGAMGQTHSECLDLKDFLVPTFIADMPIDPMGTSEISKYAIFEESKGRISVVSCLLEKGEDEVPEEIPLPISFWSFDENEGCTTQDLYGNNDGTLDPDCPSNSPLWVEGINNSGLYFDGTNKRVSVQNSPNLNPTDELTISAWLKWDIPPNTGQNWTAIFNKSVDSQYRLQHNHNNSLFEFGIRTSEGGRWITSTTNPSEGVWYHVVGTYNGEELRIYVNGSLENSTNWSGTINTFPTPLVLGNRAIGDRGFNGILDEMGIWDKALSAEEVSSLYLNGLTHTETPEEEIVNKAVKAENFTANRTDWGSPQNLVDTAPLSDIWRLDDGGDNLSDWVKYDMEEPTSVSSYELTVNGGDPSRSPKKWEFQGSNDNFDTHEVLDLQENIVNWEAETPQYFELSETANYRYYRIFIYESNHPSRTSLARVKIF